MTENASPVMTLMFEMLLFERDTLAFSAAFGLISMAIPFLTKRDAICEMVASPAYPSTIISVCFNLASSNIVS